MRRIFAFLLLSLSLSAGATSFSTDFSDLWWNPNESGWGVNVSQQSGTIFATLFVYSASDQTTWYVAPSIQYAGTEGSGDLLFTGPLYQTSGPYFVGPFNPTSVGFRQVGQMSFTFDSVSTGTVTYSVDGAGVTKRVTRQLWATNDISGSYIGADIGTYSGCPTNGYQEEAAVVTITQSGSNVTMAAVGSAINCNYSGTYTQAGRMGAIAGTFACTNGASGTFQAFEIEASISGLTGRANTQYGGTCKWSGRFGGLRRGQ